MRIQYFLHSYIFLIFLLDFIKGEKTSQLVSCSEVPFCQRFMFWGDNNNPPLFAIDQKSIKIDNNIIRGIITNENLDNDNEIQSSLKKLEFELFILKKGIIRIKIRPFYKDKNYTKRFELNEKDDIFKMKKAKKNKNFSILKNDSFIFVETKLSKNSDILTCKINYNPFKIEYYINGNLMFYINKYNLFDIEIPEKEYVTKETDSISTIKIDITIPKVNLLSGLPGRRGSSILKDTTNKNDELYHFYNIDIFKFKNDQYNNIYGEIPFIMSHSYNESLIGGIYWNNPSETFISIENGNNSINTNNNKDEINKKLLFISEDGIFDISLLYGKNLYDFYKSINLYVGKTPIPPIFSLGYHQSRFSYENIEDVNTIESKFDDYNIPYDALWFDIDHTDEKKYFTYSVKNFPRRKLTKFLNELEQKGRKAIFIIDPHIKKDNWYKIYHHSSLNNYFIKIDEEQNFVGRCWCGDASYLDFYNKEVVNYWKYLFLNSDNYFLNPNIIHVWNDMNEPSVFNIERNTIPKKALTIYDGKNYEHRSNHNIYGYLMHKATYKAMKEKYKNKIRPFVLTRSFYIGSNRYAATWTGDTLSDYESLQDTITMLLSLSISGYSFAGADVGGFVNNVTPDLLKRWYQVGVFYPFFRAHSHSSTNRREIYLYSKEDFLNLLESILIRYSILPYIYNQFYLNNKFGNPILKPLWFFEKFNKINSTIIEKEYYFGESILVRPVLTYSESITNMIEIYLPSNERWYKFYNNKEIHKKGKRNYKIDEFSIGAFIKGGSIIPKKLRLRRNSAKMKDDPLSLFIYLNNDLEAKGFIYFDDENSFEYRKGNYSLLNIYYHKNNTINFYWEKSGYRVKNKIDKIKICGLKEPGKIKEGKVTYNQFFYKLRLRQVNVKNQTIIELSGFNNIDIKIIQNIIMK